MAVLLKNLMARHPGTAELPAISELVAICENDTDHQAAHWQDELLSVWSHPDFRLASDAWVIVTTAGQYVAFACVWASEPVRLATMLCVHPAYRERGVGTLLLRMVEVRARQLAREVPADQRVVLRAAINHANQGAQRLYEREGYQPGRPFLRVIFTLPEEGDQQMLARSRFRVNVGLEHQERLSPLHDQDALCSVTLYRPYEKELRPLPGLGEIHTELQVLNLV